MFTFISFASLLSFFGGGRGAGGAGTRLCDIKYFYIIQIIGTQFMVSSN